MTFSDFIWKYFKDTGISIGAYIIFYQGGPIYHSTHVPGPVDQPSTESEYNAACISVMALANFSRLIHELLNKDTYIVPEEAPLVFLDSKSDMRMTNNGNDTKKTLQITRRMHLIRNG